MSDAETAASEGIPETLVEEDEVGKVDRAFVVWDPWTSALVTL